MKSGNFKRIRNGRIGIAENYGMDVLLSIPPAKDTYSSGWMPSVKQAQGAGEAEKQSVWLETKIPWNSSRIQDARMLSPRTFFLTQLSQNWGKSRNTNRQIRTVLRKAGSL